MTPASFSLSDRLLNTALRRSRKAIKTLPLLKRLAAGDIVIPERALNKVLRTAGLDEELPMHWETIEVRMREGYFELDLQGAVKFLHGPTFRLQARFESVEISLARQVVRIRLMREIQTFGHGLLERVLTIFVRSLFGSLMHPNSLFKMADKSHVAFTQEEPNLLRIELHRLEPVQRNLSGNILGAAGAVLGKETVLVRAIDCHQGEMVIRTTTVAREMANKAIKLGVAAGSVANRAMGALQSVGRQVLQDMRTLQESTQDLLPEEEEDT